MSLADQILNDQFRPPDYLFYFHCFYLHFFAAQVPGIDLHRNYFE